MEKGEERYEAANQEAAAGSARESISTDNLAVTKYRKCVMHGPFFKDGK